MYLAYLLASGLMAFTAAVWMYQPVNARTPDASDRVEIMLACLLLNAAAFDLWLLSTGWHNALRLWALHAAGAGMAGVVSSLRPTIRLSLQTPRALASSITYLMLALLAATLAGPHTVLKANTAGPSQNSSPLTHFFIPQGDKNG